MWRFSKNGNCRRATPPSQPYQRGEKNEKGEKHEKNEREKEEKHEKGEFGYIGWLIGGIIVILIGITAYFRATGNLTSPMQGAVVVLIIGVALIVVAVWLSTMARKT